MNLTPKALDSLSSRLKNKEVWEQRGQIHMRITVDNFLSGYCKINLSHSDSFIDPDGIMKPEERKELLTHIKDYLNECIEKRTKEAKREFNKQLLGED